MCGIVGLIGKTSSQLDQRLVGHLSESMIHRGPDGEGRFGGSQFAIAMRRLAIIDLTGGWQPLYNEDQSISLVANGEIYNFVELRRDLESRGHVFRTKSDCETIAHLYEEYGEQAVQHLRGMFAFALYDARKNKLLLARDRMGEKPMYLVESDDRLIFSSELKSLVKAGIVPVELDDAAVVDYYHFGYVPEPRCILKGVRKLPAAHFLSVDLNTFERHQVKYWDMMDAPELKGDPIPVLREELNRICELIVRSDVPVGIALSSGLDSSSLATLTHRRYPGMLEAFTVSYEGNSRQDESVAAKQLTDYLGVSHNTVLLRDQDAVDEFPQMCFKRDDPIADIAGSGYLAVMRAAREKNVPVMIMGHGGDELFWGYPWIRQALRRTYLKRGLLTAPFTTRVRDYLRITKPPRSIPLGIRWLKNLCGLRAGYKDYCHDRNSPVDQFAFYDTGGSERETLAEMQAVGEAGFLQRAQSASVGSHFHVPQPWNHIDARMIKMICDTYLMENGLAQGDRLSMATSVELRVPLVDYRLVEIAIGIAKANPTRDPGAKTHLRQVFKEIVPDFVFNRPKTGFNAPWRRWMEGYRKQYGQLVRDGFLAEAGFIQRGLPGNQVGLRTLTLEIWCREMKACQNTAKPMQLAAVPVS
jgi:asparagine synthase (glutamine-hydrolysing)